MAACIAALMYPLFRPQRLNAGKTYRADPSSCPSVLMFDGVSVAKDVNDAKAKYWGEDIGIDGFFLDYVMAGWQNTVPDDETSPEYLHLKDFENVYSRHGVNQNFIKVATYKAVDWKNAAELAQIVDNFRRAAHMARFAGIRGIALDLEPYAKGFWEVDPTDPEKPNAVYNTGKAIGNAIEKAYPGSPVFVIREALWWQNRAPNYALSGHFWDGLMASSVPHIYLGEELTYDKPGIPDELRTMYRDDALRNHVDPAKFEIDPAFWPLGHSYTDKSPRTPVDQFSRELEDAFAQHPRYVWIYGFGSAWETDGPYGKGPVALNFRDYIAALHRAKSQCASR
jgi:hypothetical protein